MTVPDTIRYIIGSLIAALTLSLTAHADAPQVIKVELAETGSNTYRIDVTLKHGDTGWKHYADKWDVVGPEEQIIATRILHHPHVDEQIIATRILHHPHVDEQPFTRSLSGVKLAPKIRFIRIRPHDKKHGYGNMFDYISVPRRSVPPKCRPGESPDLTGKSKTTKIH